MQTRYIRKEDRLYYAMIIDGKYSMPVTVNKQIAQPQYIILSEKSNLYEVMYYTFYKAIQDPDYASPALQKQMFIPTSHVVKVGEPVQSSL